MNWRKYLTAPESKSLATLTAARESTKRELAMFSKAIATIRNRCVLRQRADRK